MIFQKRYGVDNDEVSGSIFHFTDLMWLSEYGISPIQGSVAGTRAVGG